MLTKFENELTLLDIENCLQTSNCDVMSQNITQLLADRWEKIRHSSASYTQQPLNLVNQLCLELATELSPLPTTEDDINDLDVGAGPYFLLMPSLEAHQDVFGSNIHNLGIHQFVLSDDQRLFIPIEGCLNHAFESDTGHFEHVVSLVNQYPELSANELFRVSRHSTPVNEYYNAITAYNDQRLHGDDLGVHLNTLANALRAGGAHGGRGGLEMDSGAAANEGIVAFTGYWDSLTPAQQRAHFQRHPSLEQTLGRLMRPDDANYRNTTYCVELIADALDPIIENCNQGERRTTELRRNVILKKDRLSSAPKVEHYPSAWLITAKPPKIWQKIFTLPERSQQYLFQHTPYRNALLYALENDPLALPEYSHLLNDKSIKLAIQSKFANNDSALILAARAGGAEAVEILLGFGARTAAANSSGETALATAIRGRHRATVAALLNSEATILDSAGVNLLGLAIELHLDTEILPLLLNKAITYPLKKQKELLCTIQNGIYNNVVMLVADCYPAQLNQLLETTKTQLDRSSLPAILRSQNRHGDTALILTAKAGNDIATRILLELGADKHAFSVNGNTMLHWAANNGHVNIISMLSEHHDLTEITNMDGDTALLLAIKAGHAAVLDALLENGANIKARNNKGENAIDLAKRLHPELGQRILLKAVTLNAREQREFLHNTSNGVFDNVLMYTASNCPALLDPLLEVISQNGQQLPNNILNSRNGLNETPLILAAKAGHANACAKLLDLGADIEASNHNNRTALHAAALEGHADVVTLLLERNALIGAQDDSGNTPFNLATQNGQANILNSLQTSGARLNCRNYHGENAFDIAARLHPELINVLLLSAILLTPDDQREFLLNQEEGRYSSIVAYVADKRVNLLELLFVVMQENNIGCPDDILNGRNAENKTPLIIAAQAGRAPIVQALMQLGASVNARDHHGDNALHHAIREGHGDVVDVLLTAEINTLSHRNNQLENAIDLAIRLHPEIIPSLLTKAIALPLRQQKEFLHNVSGGIYDCVLAYAATERQYTIPQLLVLCGKNQHEYDAAVEQMNVFFNFDTHIQPMKTKLLEMEAKHGAGYNDATAAARTLITKLEQARNIFALNNGGINEKKTSFKNSCMSAITEARPVLEKHRDWGKVIGCFLLALITFPISLPLIAFGVFSLKTNSAQKLNVLENEIEEALPCPVA